MSEEQFNLIMEQLKLLEENQDDLQLLYKEELDRQAQEREKQEQQKQELAQTQETIVEVPDPILNAINENSIYIQQVFFLCFIIVCFLILQFIWRMVYKAFAIFLGGR